MSFLTSNASESWQSGTGQRFLLDTKQFLYVKERDLELCVNLLNFRSLRT